jgi:hypothetical protein
LRTWLTGNADQRSVQSLEEARRRNRIRGATAVNNLIKQYGREDILPKRVKVETVNEIDELKEARKRIRELEAAQDVSAHGLLP